MSKFLDRGEAEFVNSLLGSSNETIEASSKIERGFVATFTSILYGLEGSVVASVESVEPKSIDLLLVPYIDSVNADVAGVKCGLISSFATVARCSIGTDFVNSFLMSDSKFVHWSGWVINE